MEPVVPPGVVSFMPPTTPVNRLKARCRVLTLPAPQAKTEVVFQWQHELNVFTASPRKKALKIPLPPPPRGGEGFHCIQLPKLRQLHVGVAAPIADS